MNEEEEPVFDRISRVLTEVDGSLKICSEALSVIAAELFETRRDITKLLEQMKDSLSKIAGEPEKPWKPETTTVEETKSEEAVSMPSSKPPWQKEETK